MKKLPALALCLGLTAAGVTSQSTYESRTDEDQLAMRVFTPFLGTWVEPETEARGFELAWGFEEKTVHLVEFRIVDGERELLSEALAGWHYGYREIVFHEFVRDHRPFEVMNTGSFRGEGTALVRQFHSFDPDGSSLEYRERYTIDETGTLTHQVEYREAGGPWAPWGTFRAKRVAADQ